MSVFMKIPPASFPSTHDSEQMDFERDKSRKLEAMTITISDPPVIAAPLEKPISECKVAIAATVGLHMQQDEPFIITGDESYRIIPNDIPYSQLMITHVRYPNIYAHKDLDCVFPLETLRQFEREGLIGSVAERSFGFMGHMPRVDVLIERTAPEVADMLVEDGVDIVILSPG